MQITPETAKRAHALITLCGTPARAAGDCRMQLQAIHPYGDRALTRVLETLDYIAGKTPERQAILVGQLAQLVEGGR